MRATNSVPRVLPHLRIFFEGELAELCPVTSSKYGGQDFQGWVNRAQKSSELCPTRFAKYAGQNFKGKLVELT